MINEVSQVNGRRKGPGQPEAATLGASAFRHAFEPIPTGQSKPDPPEVKVEVWV